MANKKIPQALAQYCVDNTPAKVDLNGKVQPYDFNGTNTNRLTGESDRVGRKGWCYEGDGIYTLNIGGSFSIDHIIADVDDGTGWVSDVDISGILSGRILTFTNLYKYKNIRAYVTSISDSNLRFKNVSEEESGTIAYDISGNDNHGTISNSNIHTQDDDVTFSDANDRGAGIVAKDLNRAAIASGNIVTLASDFKLKYVFEVYPFFTNGNKYYLSIRGSGIIIYLTIANNTTSSVTLNNSGTNVSFTTDGISLYNRLLTLVIERNSTVVSVSLSNDIGESVSPPTQVFTPNMEMNEFSYIDLTGNLTDYANGSLKSLEVWDGAPFTDGEAEYAWLDFTNSNLDTGSAGLSYDLNPATKIVTDGVVPLLEDGVTPANSNITQAQYIGQYKPYLQIENSPCLNFTFANSNQLQFTDLAGVVSVTNEGTAMLSISGNNLVLNSGADDGTVFGVKLWSGAGGTGTLIDELPCCENAGSIANSVYDSANYSATISGTLTNVWAITQNVYSFLQAKGGSVSTGSGSVPLGGFIPTKLDASGNSTFEDVQGNDLDPVLCEGRAIQEFDNEINVNPETIPAITQMGYDDVITSKNIPDSSLGILFGALKARSENGGYNNLTLFSRGVDNIAPCVTLNGIDQDIRSQDIANTQAQWSAWNDGKKITHEFWLNCDSSAPAATETIYGNIGLQVLSGGTFENVGNIGASFSDVVDLGTDLRDDEWHFIKHIHDVDNKTHSIYIDGVLESQRVYTSYSVTDDEVRNGVIYPLYYGSRTGTLQFFQGSIAGIKVYNEDNPSDVFLQLPLIEGAGSICNVVKKDTTNPVDDYELQASTTANWAITQTVYDYLGAYGGTIQSGVNIPAKLPLDGTDVLGNNLTTEEIERVLDQQQGLALNKKI